MQRIGAWGVVAMTVCAAVAGCNAVGSAPSGAAELNTERAASAAVGRPRADHEDEPNDDFDTARPLTVPAGGAAHAAGQLFWSEDVDVYDLGPATAGWRWQAELTAEADAVPGAALFDASGALLARAMPDREAGNTWRIDVVTPYDSDAWLLAIAGRPDTESSGDYQLHVFGEDTGSIPQARPQTVLLNFSGTDSLALCGQTPDIPPFRAESIDPALAGETDRMIEVITEAVRADFAAFEVRIVTSRDELPPETPFTTIHFGAYDPDLLGLAEQVDARNQDQGDVAVVFVDSFTAFLELEPGPDELAQALANIASHEIGHLLGLVHTTGDHDQMDVTATCSEVLEDRWFTRSPLDPRVFPIGEQDAPAQLARTVGLRAQPEGITDPPLRTIDPQGRNRPISTAGVEPTAGAF